MADIPISAKVTGVVDLNSKIGALRAAVISITAGKQVQDLLISRIKKRFITKIGPDGKRWKDNSPTTQRLRRRAGKRANYPLVSSGELRKSIKVIRGRIASGATGLVTNSRFGFRIGSALPYANVQHRGGFSNWPGRARRIPARPFLGIGPQDVTAVEGLMRKLMGGYAK